MNDAMRVVAALALGAAASGAGAAGLDGESRMICAATQAVVCQSAGDCVTGAPEAVNLPVFWHVDPKAKVVKSRTAERGERTSDVTTVETEGGHLVLQGSDEGFGWSLTVNSASGAMLMSGGQDVGYLVFGECTTP